jgi:hypothetical protein
MELKMIKDDNPIKYEKIKEDLEWKNWFTYLSQ